uniref:RNA-directed DNA polymerase from mobile element jockey-like n=1 Tax=Strongyloides papillosus TaxID=174720 RepID=A0A0N5BU69_STREA
MCFDNNLIDDESSVKLKIDGKEIEKVSQFKYLGKIISINEKIYKNTLPKDDNSWNSFLSERIRGGWISFHKHKRLLLDHSIALEKRINLYVQLVRPSILYSCQCWNLLKTQYLRLQSNENKMIRLISRKSILDHINIKELYNSIGLTPIVNVVFRLKLRFIGHTVRQKLNKPAKMSLQHFPYGFKRRKGRPPLRYTDCLKSRSLWLRDCLDRNLWKSTNSQINLLDRLYLDKS